MSRTRSPRYRPVLSIRELFAVLEAGLYRVCTETGAVYGHRGKPLKPDRRGRARGGNYQFVRLYVVRSGVRKVKTIAVSRLVWMVATGAEIPPGFEIHHEDEDVDHNAFDNLICLHKLDHRKKHRRDYDPNEVPF